jgi:hypothetical protein
MNPDTNRLSNTIALEAFNTEENAEGNKGDASTDTDTDGGGGTNQKPADEQKPATTGATYFFRVTGRKEYALTKDEDLAEDLGGFIKDVNRSMIEVNFRREPIYLTENQLESTEYTQYRFAIAKIPSLRTLRDRFVGRVIHSSQDQWRADVTNLLAFNTKSIDDSEKWIKGEDQ